jgi:hypothetical protein
MRILIFAISAAILMGSGVRAHHSYAGFYDPKDRTVLIDGTLEEYLYANPHVQFVIRTADATTYTVIWQASTWVKRQANVDAGTFRTGDRLIVIGSPSKDPSEHQVTQVREVRRPSDGWVWRSGAPFAPPS